MFASGKLLMNSAGGDAGPVIEAISSASMSNIASISCDVPAGTSVGDILIVAATASTTTVPAVEPSDPSWTVLFQRNSGNLNFLICTKEVQVGDPTSYAFQTIGGVNRGISIGMIRVSNGQIDVVGDPAAGNVGSITINSSTALSPENVLLMFGRCASGSPGSSWTGPVGMSKELEILTYANLAIFSEYVGAGATGPRSFSYSGFVASLGISLIIGPK